MLHISTSGDNGKDRDSTAKSIPLLEKTQIYSLKYKMNSITGQWFMVE
jgi:hypothetical protein